MPPSRQPVSAEPPGAAPGDASESSDGSSARSARAWLTLAVLAIYFLVMLVCQRLSGAPLAAFGSYPDEPSHYISGMLVHDYLKSGFSKSPVQYATEYYARVPFFAVGYWPPLFYVIEGLWMTVFGLDRAAVLPLIALIAAGIATLIFVCLRREFGNWTAFGAGIIFLFLPVVQWSSRLVMTDLTVTLLSFAAALAFARFIESKRFAPIAAFSVLAAATLLTKGSGGFLILLPPLAILASGKLRLFGRISLWTAPFIVAALYGPWFLLTHSLATRGFDGYHRPPLPVILQGMGTGIAANLLLLIPFVLAGIWSVVRDSRPASGLIAVCLAQPVAVLAFLMATPVGYETRYLTPLLPPLLILGLYGARFVISLVSRPRPLVSTAVLTGLLAAFFVVKAITLIPSLPPDPYRPIARFALARGYRSVLVGADSEGPMIAAIAELEPDRTARLLVRPNKLLARTNWEGTVYQNTYGTKEEMQALFDRLPLDVLLVRMDPPLDAPPHEILVRDMILANPSRWRLASSFEAQVPEATGSVHYGAYEPLKLREVPDDELRHDLRSLLDQSPSVLR